MAQETTTAMYGRAAIVFAQLAFEVEDPAVKEYWGDFSDDGGKNKFEALNLSMYDFARAVVDPIPSVGENYAKPYVSPQMLRMVMIMLGKDDILFADADKEFMDLETVFEMHRMYYRLYKLEFVEIHNPNTDCTMPLITRKSMLTWFGYRILLWPDDTLNAVNKMLKDFPLHDPSEEQPWKYKVIPRSCFPPKENLGVPNADQARAQLESVWQKAKSDHLAAARRRGPRPSADVSTLGIMNQAAENSIQMSLMAANNTSRMAAANAASWAATQNALTMQAAMTAQMSAIF